MDIPDGKVTVVLLDNPTFWNYPSLMQAEIEETRSMQIANILAERIILGEISPGVRLRQDHIAAEFATSHVPVREAFRELQMRGLAEALPRRGFRVTEFDLAELREVGEMRASLEALALRHAVPNMRKEIFIEAEEVIRCGHQARSVREWEATNQHFHRLILSPCQMPRLLRTIDDLHLASTRFLFSAWRQDWKVRADQEHRRILDSLRKGDTEMACKTLMRHVGWIGRRKKK